MGIHGKMLDFLAELLCGVSALQSRREKALRKEQARLDAQRPRHKPKYRYEVSTPFREKRTAREDEKPAKLGLGFRTTAQQWGEATGALLEELSTECEMPAKPAPVKRMSRRSRPLTAPTNEGMTSSQLSEVIAIIGRIFDHLPYAICGQTAMVYYGSLAYRPSHVSVLVPQASGEIARCWALAQGMQAVPCRSDCFAVRTRDGRLRTVRLKLVKDTSFEHVETMQAVRSRARLITLPGLANQVAGAYVADLKSGGSEKRQAAYAEDMRWILQKIGDCNLDEHWLFPWRARELLRGEFWLPFTTSFRDTVNLFAYAGLHVRDNEGLSQDGSYTGEVSNVRGGQVLGGIFTD